LKRIKRKRGGQRGNQNARKHGFYSSSFTPDELNRFRRIITQESIDPEMAALRVKLQSLISQGGVTPFICKEAVRLIVKWSAKKYHLNRADRAILKSATLKLFESIPGFNSVGTNRSLK
jgi:hypothetical protein